MSTTETNQADQADQADQQAHQQAQQPAYGQQPAYAQGHGHQPAYGQHPGQVAQWGEPRSPQGVPLAGQGRRLGARLIDSMLLTLLLFVPLLVIGGGMFAEMLRRLEAIDESQPSATYDAQVDQVWSDLGPPLLALMFGWVLLSWIVSLAYEGLIIARTGATLGKKWLGIKVVRLSDGQPPATGASFCRALLSIVLSGIYIDQLWCLWDKPWRQCLHDKPVDTVVVDVRAQR